jgi:hypothetical protein
MQQCPATPDDSTANAEPGPLSLDAAQFDVLAHVLRGSEGRETGIADA